MPTRAEDLVNRFEAATNDAIAAVEACPDNKWNAATPNDGRPVNVLFHHIATGDVPISGFVTGIATGQGIPPITTEMLDQGNAQHAQQMANVTKEQVIAELKQNCATAAAAVRGLSDEQLDRKATGFGREWTAQQAAEMILIGHIQDHMGTIRAALA